jgi:FkbM family methyltransferase
VGLKEAVLLVLLFVNKTVIGQFYSNRWRNYLLQVRVLGHPMYITMKDKGLSQELLTYGIHEPFLSLLISNEIRENDVMIDIGSNIGYYALFYCSNLKSKRIISIEPDPRSFRVLKMNLILNTCNNFVKTYNVAIGPENKRAFIHLKTAFNVTSISSSSISSQNDRAVREINLVTLDDLLASELKADILRMDIEGYEFQAIKGMMNVLRRLRPRLLFLELGPSESKDIMYSFFETLNNLGYEIKRVIPRRLIDAMLSVPQPLLKETVSIINGNIPHAVKLPHAKSIDLKEFWKTFCIPNTNYHIVLSRRETSNDT